MSLLIGLKQQYNESLIRLKKAEAFMDGPAPIKEKEKWQPEFQSIAEKLNNLYDDIRMAGYVMTPDEIENGFI